MVEHTELKDLNAAQHALSLEMISQAISYLNGKIRRTPIEFSPVLSDLLNAPVYLKLESLQLTGSFKVRGALFYLSTLDENQKNKGVATCSAGNHGLGLAYAAKQENIHCTVYVPRSVDRAKEEKIMKLGAHVIRSEFDGYDETLAWAKSEVENNGKHFISAFEDDKIMAGNGGTIAAEILEDVPHVQNVLFPVGGGGLSAGMAYYFHAVNPSIKLIGCQHQDSPALDLSLKRGKAVTVLPSIDTVAGGIEGGIGDQCFEVLKSRIHAVSLLSEEEIHEAFRWVLKHHQYLVEPSSVVTIASCLVNKIPKISGDTVVLLSGRNVAYSTLQRLIAQ